MKSLGRFGIDEIPGITYFFPGFGIVGAGGYQKYLAQNQTSLNQASREVLKNIFLGPT